MSLVDAVVFDENIIYTSPTEETLDDQYDRLSSLRLPFQLNHFQTKNGNRHLRKWYFNSDGELVPKRLYKLEKTQIRRYLRWNPTVVTSGELWNRIVGNITQSFTSRSFPYTNMNSVLHITVDNGEARASFGDGYESGILQLSSFASVNPTAVVSWGFYCSEDGNDLETTNNYIICGINTDSILFLKNGQTNETQTLSYPITANSNVGIVLDSSDGSFYMIDSGYFLTYGTTNFTITNKLYPFVVVSSDSTAEVDFKLKNSRDIMDNGYYPDTVKHPTLPSVFNYPSPMLYGKKYIVTDTNQFSIYRGHQLQLNEIVIFYPE